MTTQEQLEQQVGHTVALSFTNGSLLVDELVIYGDGFNIGLPQGPRGSAQGFYLTQTAVKEIHGNVIILH